MAKALLGFATATDPRVLTRLASQNRLLRQRVADLEEIVLRLQRENDALRLELSGLTALAEPTEVLAPA